uniref:DDE Tnp4 domain-containing protein n=1 Tax=Amphimedon queenslandica TaxID=400682 RepID=A0A1X7U0Y7_AMPQE
MIKWPTQEIAQMNLPPLFARLYPKTRCIMDCSEIYIERPYAKIAVVEESKLLAKVRIDVERVIGLLQNKYTTLQSRLPITLLKKKNDKDYAFIAKKLTVCCALTNLSPSIVPF